jgi:hypothetical protein
MIMSIQRTRRASVVYSYRQDLRVWGYPGMMIIFYFTFYIESCRAFLALLTAGKLGGQPRRS